VGMVPVDAVIEVARADTPREWVRYCTVAARVISNVPDAARELLRRRLARVTYDGLQRAWSHDPEEKASIGLEDIFLTNFMVAAHAGRYCVCGFPHGEFTATVVDRTLIKAEAFKRIIKGEQEWELNGTRLYGISVELVMTPGPPSPSPEPKDASETDIHAEIKAIYDDCEKTGCDRPNLKKIGKLVQDRLRVKGLYASQGNIRELARDKRYVGIRHRPGPRPRRKPAETPPRKR
jgi:hypothetical protein